MDIFFLNNTSRNATDASSDGKGLLTGMGKRKLEELEFVRFANCQNQEMSQLEIVKMGNCKLSESEFRASTS